MDTATTNRPRRLTSRDKGRRLDTAERMLTHFRASITMARSQRSLIATIEATKALEYAVQLMRADSERLSMEPEAKP